MKRIFQCLTVLAFLAVFGTVGGVECGSIGFFDGGILATASILAGILFAKLGGMFYGR